MTAALTGTALAGRACCSVANTSEHTLSILGPREPRQGRLSAALHRSGHGGRRDSPARCHPAGSGRRGTRGASGTRQPARVWATAVQTDRVRFGSGSKPRTPDTLSSYKTCLFIKSCVLHLPVQLCVSTDEQTEPEDCREQQGRRAAPRPRTTVPGSPTPAELVRTFTAQY